MPDASGSLLGYQNSGSTVDETSPRAGDQRLQSAGWGPAMFFAAMIVIMMISAVLVTAISCK
jgi:hypothetical protein